MKTYQYSKLYPVLHSSPQKGISLQCAQQAAAMSTLTPQALTATGTLARQNTINGDVVNSEEERERERDEGVGEGH